MPEKEQDELSVLRRINSGSVTVEELEKFGDEFSHRQRIQVALVQHPRFPQKRALNIISSLFPGDLLKVLRNKRTNPLIRRRGEVEFLNKFQRLPLGEKITCLKIAPVELLMKFNRLNDARLLHALLENPSCTESVVIGMIQGGGDHQGLYNALDGSDWLRRPGVVSAVSRDPLAPVKALLVISPYLNKQDRSRLLSRPGTHKTVKIRLKSRASGA